jgi:hypothetical protein
MRSQRKRDAVRYDAGGMVNAAGRKCLNAVLTALLMPVLMGILS